MNQPGDRASAATEMRVYHVFPYPWYVTGGHANGARTIIEAQARQGVDARAISPGPDPARLRHPVPQVDISAGRGTVMATLRAHTLDAPAPAAPLSHGAGVLRVPAAPCPVSYLDYESADWEAAVTNALAESAGREVLFHLHHIKQCVRVARVLRRRGIPYVYTSQGELHAKGAQSFAKKFLYVNCLSRIVRGAAGVHVATERERDHLRYLIPGYAGPTASIPNIVELPPAGSVTPAPREKFSVPADCFLFLFFGRLDIAQKGLDLLLDAFARAAKQDPTVRLGLIGPDFRGNKATLEQQAASLGVADRVQFLPPQYGPDKWSALAMADAFASPSRWEGFGIAIAEAMGMRLPTVTAESANLAPEAARAGAALVSAFDADALAAKMAELRRDHELRAKLADNGEQWVRSHCSIDAVGVRFREFYRSVLRQARGTATTRAVAA